MKESQEEFERELSVLGIGGGLSSGVVLRDDSVLGILGWTMVVTVPVVLLQVRRGMQLEGVQRDSLMAVCSG